MGLFRIRLTCFLSFLFFSYEIIEWLHVLGSSTSTKDDLTRSDDAKSGRAKARATDAPNGATLWLFDWIA